MKEPVTIFKEFPEACCGKKYFESLKIENKSKVIKSYEIHQIKNSEYSEIYDCRLQIQPMKTTVQPSKTFQFSITYSSNIPNLTDNFIYDVTSGGTRLAVLNIHGKSVGPVLSLSPNNLKFCCFRGMTETTKQIEMINNGKCETKFFFDLDADDQILKIYPASGIIPAETKIGLKITFKPYENGVYYKQIYCLALYHEPLLLTILGIYKPKLKVDIKSLVFKYPPQDSFKNVYESYMSKLYQQLSEDEKPHVVHKCAKQETMNLDSAKIEEQKEPDKKFWSFTLKSTSINTEQTVEKLNNNIVLSSYYIDIKNLSELHKATTLENQSKTLTYQYLWYHDPKDHFQIKPCKGILHPQVKQDFSVFFTSSILDFIYHIELDLRIFPVDGAEPDVNQGVDLPLTKSLRIIGHSFPDDSCGWIPQCLVSPKVLQLPPCVPNEVVYGTFSMERKGHLPVSFVTTPIKDQSYKVQPSLGYLFDNFQLFVVQFNAENKEKGVYEEEIIIRVNNSESHFTTIKLFTSVEEPDLFFGHYDSFTFEPALPQTKNSAKMLIQNPTNLTLIYEFEVPNDVTWVKIPQPKGVIDPHSFGHIELLYEPEEAREYLDYIPCTVASVTMPEYTQIVLLQVMGTCQYGYLVATPCMYDFGECNYKEKKSAIITLFNFSPVVLHCKLSSIRIGFSIGDIEKDVKISPEKGTILPKQSMKVEISVVPSFVEAASYSIICQNFENSTDEAKPCERGRTVFFFRVEGVLPSFKFIDLYIENGGPLFSPHMVWKMMNIEKINKALNSISTGEPIPIRFPEAVVNSFAISIALLLEVNRYDEISFFIKKPEAFECSGSFIHMDVTKPKECIHRNSISVYPKKFKLEPRKRSLLHFHLQYNSLKPYQTEWIIHLPHKRKVVLTTEFKSLPEEGLNCTSMYLLPVFNLKPTYIGYLEPFIHLFWLYNNTPRPSNYAVEKITLKGKYSFLFKIFECLNPKGTIPPFSSLPLAFRFHPFEIESYEAEAKLRLRDDEIINLILQGEGIFYHYQIPELSFEPTVPRKPILYNTNVELEMSLNLINIQFIKTHSQVSRLFMMRNKSKTDLWAFQWHKFKIEDILEASITPEKGVVEPEQETILSVTLESFKHGSHISISIPCDVINYTNQLKYEKGLRYQEYIKEATKDYFTITEKGEFFEAPEIQIPDKPNSSHIFLTINLNVISYENLESLSLKQQLKMASNKNLGFVTDKIKFYDDNLTPSIQFLLEKMLWNILCSEIVEEKVKHLRETNDNCYLQIFPEPKRNFSSVMPELAFEPNRMFVQKYLEDSIKSVITKNLVKKKFF